MFKKIIYSTLIAFAVSVIGFSSLNAQVLIEPYIPPAEGVFGQNQYYSVVYDGEGEAAVGAKLVMQNNSEEEVKETIIEVPGQKVRMIRAVQEVYPKERYCRRWGEDVCVKEGQYGCAKYERECLEWTWQVKTWEPVYYTLDPVAEKLSNSIKYTIELDEPLQEQQETAILLYYKVEDQVDKSWGVFNFKFETVKASYDINSVRVAVNVQEGYHLKGGEAETQYQSSYDYGSDFEEVAPMAAGVQSKALSNFSNQITYTRGYTKTTSGLDPWESFTVEGKYAKSRMALYRVAIISWIVGILVFLAGIGLLTWWLIRRSSKKDKISSKKKINRPELMPLKIIGTGVGVSIGIIILVILTGLLSQVIERHVYYQYTGMIGLLLILLDGVIILAAIFGPSLYFGIKHGAAKGVWVLATTIVSLLILGTIVMLVFLAITGGSYRPLY